MRAPLEDSALTSEVFGHAFSIADVGSFDSLARSFQSLEPAEQSEKKVV